MQYEWIFSGIGISAIGAILSLFTGVLSITASKKEKKQSLETKIKELSGALKNSVELIQQMQFEIEERQKLVEKLQKDANTYNEIIQVNSGEVEAIAQVLRAELKHEGKKTFWQGVGINFLFFILGVLASIVVK